MAIAIKQLERNDIDAFSEFLKTPRKDLMDLRFSPLVKPHEDILVVAFKNNIHPLNKFAEKYNFVLTEYDYKIVSLSRHEPVKNIDNTRYIFSGYVFSDKKMLIGVDEVAENVRDIRAISENCGEFCSCIIGNGSIRFSADYFGMSPLFYFDNKDVFVASDNYHLLLLVLREIGIKLCMNIPRSRVNIVTSGFTYGTAFSKDLDVNGCKMNLAYEEVHYSVDRGLTLPRTSLWELLSDKNEWDEEQYEECIYKAKNELEEYCKAAFEHPRFNKVVVDVSGGFDSRIVFATACNLPKHLRKKMYTHTRRSGTKDDIEKASAVTNLYDYPKHSYSQADTSELFCGNNEINLAHISRTLGTFSVCSYLYISDYDDQNTLEITGYLGEVVLGYMRCRGEAQYSLGDQRLLARLGGCYLHNSVDELQEVFNDQKRIINETLDNYVSCDCLFKKMQQLYIDSRNRFICGSARNLENNNLRIPMLFTKNALKAKWMYFNRFPDNQVPDEKISLDLVAAINPLIASLPFASNNDNVISKPENLLNPVSVNIQPNVTFKPGPKPNNAEDLYKNKVMEYTDNLEIAEQMLLHIYDYSDEYYPVCLGLYKVISLFKENPDDAKSGHGRETIRKIYDIYYQIRLVEE